MIKNAKRASPSEIAPVYLMDAFNHGLMDYALGEPLDSFAYAGGVVWTPQGRPIIQSALYEAGRLVAAYCIANNIPVPKGASERARIVSIINNS